MRTRNRPKAPLEKLPKRCRCAIQRRPDSNVKDGKCNGERLAEALVINGSKDENVSPFASVRNPQLPSEPECHTAFQSEEGYLSALALTTAQAAQAAAEIKLKRSLSVEAETKAKGKYSSQRFPCPRCELPCCAAQQLILRTRTLEVVA